MEQGALYIYRRIPNLKYIGVVFSEHYNQLPKAADSSLPKAGYSSTKTQLP
jgi:hypothetical protein